MTDIRPRWRTAVLRSTAVSDSVRVLLLVLADRMRADGTVSVPRSELARVLGRSERRITERVQAAIEAGLLDLVSTGRPGRTAVYAAKLKGADYSHQRGADGRTPRSRSKGADGGPPSSYLLKPAAEQGGHDASRTRQGVPTADLGRPLLAGLPGGGSRERESTPDLSPSLSSSPFGDHDNDRNAAHDASADVLAYRGDHKRGKSA